MIHQRSSHPLDNFGIVGDWLQLVGWQVDVWLDLGRSEYAWVLLLWELWLFAAEGELGGVAPFLEGRLDVVAALEEGILTIYWVFVVGIAVVVGQS